MLCQASKCEQQTVANSLTLSLNNKLVVLLCHCIHAQLPAISTTRTQKKIYAFSLKPSWYSLSVWWAITFSYETCFRFSSISFSNALSFVPMNLFTVIRAYCQSIYGTHDANVRERTDQSSVDGIQVYFCCHSFYLLVVFPTFSLWCFRHFSHICGTVCIEQQFGNDGLMVKNTEQFSLVLFLTAPQPFANIHRISWAEHFLSAQFRNGFVCTISKIFWNPFSYWHTKSMVQCNAKNFECKWSEICTQWIQSKSSVMKRIEYANEILPKSFPCDKVNSSGVCVLRMHVHFKHRVPFHW